MLDGLTEMTAAELSEQAAVYANRAKTGALARTQQSFERLASQCAALAGSARGSRRPCTVGR
jgi:hypothetical protein